MYKYNMGTCFRPCYVITLWIFLCFIFKAAVTVYNCPEAEGSFKYGIGENCNKYYNCSKNLATVQTCPENQGFHDVWKKCVWHGFVSACFLGGRAPICGNKPEEDQNDKRIESPWMAAVYQRDRTDSEWEYVSPGVVIGPTTILTSCRLGRRINGKWRQSVNASAYEVLVGTETVDVHNPDALVQTVKVSSVQMNPKNNHSFHSFCNALMHLNKPLNFSSYIRPICLPNMDSENHQSRLGYSGLGLLANFAEKETASDGFRHLNAKQIRLASHPYCFARTHLNNNYCGVPRLGSGIETIRNACTTQAIVSTQSTNDNSWYLLGLGTRYTQNVCSIRKIDDDPKLTWIMQSIRCGSTHFPCKSGKCINLNKVCDSQGDCPDREDENSDLCRAMNPCINEATFECGVYENCIKPEKVCDGFPDCYDASDEDPEICKHRKKAIPFNSPSSTAETETLKVTVPVTTSSSPLIPTAFALGTTLTTSVQQTAITPTTEIPSKPTNRPEGQNVTLVVPKNECPKLETSEGIKLKCALPGGGFSNCKGKLPVGTIATHTCKILYKPVYFEAQFLVKKCTAELRWKPDRTFECLPDCGRLLTSKNSPYIVNGMSISRRDLFPWHAAIFTMYKNNWVYICGATLIRRSFVLTAAHCVTDYNGDNNKLPDVFKVVLGPSSSKFDALLQDKESQIFDVRKILVHDRYDPTNNYQSDIAILAMKRPAILSANVIMACLPTSDSPEPPPGTMGQVVGFGVDESGKISDTLKYANLPIVNTEQCIKSVNFIPSVNQFCAGYSNGTGVCFGDSGGGLAFKINQRYFLYGIVSVGPRSSRKKRGLSCSQKTYSVFTSVARFGEWINYKINFMETEF